MNTLQVFLVLLWLALALLALIWGTRVTFDFAQSADDDDLPLIKALGGTALRGVATLIAVALIVGVPLDLMRF